MLFRSDAVAESVRGALAEAAIHPVNPVGVDDVAGVGSVADGVLRAQAQPEHQVVDGGRGRGQVKGAPPATRGVTFFLFAKTPAIGSKIFEHVFNA